jgi:hypothetical protein
LAKWRALEPGWRTDANSGNLLWYFTIVMNAKRSQPSVNDGSLTIKEVRLVCDLRIMHSKVDELYQVVNALKRHHDEAAIVKYATLSARNRYGQRITSVHLLPRRRTALFPDCRGTRCRSEVAMSFARSALRHPAHDAHLRCKMAMGK